MNYSTLKKTSAFQGFTKARDVVRNRSLEMSFGTTTSKVFGGRGRYNSVIQIAQWIAQSFKQFYNKVSGGGGFQSVV